MITKRIYIASSAKISKELEPIRTMIRGLNQKSLEVQFELITRENFPVEYSNKRLQDTYNEILHNCDIIIFLLDKTIGLYTIEEFNAALEDFYRHGTPRILLYVKNLQPGETNDQSLNSFLLRIAEMRQYYVEYNDYDELAQDLALLMEKERALSTELQLLRNEEESKAQNVLDINELLLKATLIMGDQCYSLADRIKQVDSFFINAERLTVVYDYKEIKERYVSILFHHVEFLIKHEQYSKSLTIGERLLDVAQSIYGESDTIVAKAYEFMGTALFQTGDIQKSIESWLKANVIFDSLPGDYAYEKREICKSLGFAYRQIGDYEKAIESFMILLQIYEKEETDSLYVATIYRAIGSVYQELRDCEKALAYYNRAVSLFDNIEENTEVIAPLYCDMGSVFYYLMNYFEAKQYFGKAEALLHSYAVKEQSYAELAMTIGTYYSLMEDSERAIQLLNAALEIYEELLGKNHPTTISIYNNLAVVYSKQGDFGKSLEYNLKATTNRKKQKWDVYLSYCKENVEAAKLFEKVLDANGITYTSKFDAIFEDNVDGEELRDPINNSVLCIALVSKDYFKEERCTKEFQIASEKGRDRFLVFVVNKEGLPPYIEQFRYTFTVRDLSDTEPASIEEHITQVITGLIRQEPITREQRQFNLEAAKERREGPTNYVPHKVDKDIFISYRRKDGRHHARIIELALKLSGYDKIFFDFSSIKDGVFNTDILDAIYSCKDFILIITPLALKRCSEKGDMVAKEIRAAIEHKKKIIPVVIGDTFNGWPDDFPEDMNCVKDIHQHKLIDDEYFDNSIEKLLSRLSSSAVNNPKKIIDNVSYKIKANKKSRLFIDDEEVAVLEPSKVTKVPLRKGQYFRKVQDFEDTKNEDETAITIGDCDIVETVILP